MLECGIRLAAHQLADLRLSTFLRTLVTTQGTVPAPEVQTMQSAGYAERRLIEIALAVATTTFTNLVDRINDMDVDFPAVN